MSTDVQQAVTLRPSTVTEMRAVAAALFVDHYDEVAKNKGTTPLSPDWGVYQTLENQGKLILIAAWAGETMVGYSASMVGPHPHYSTTVMAQNDVLFVAKDHRRGRVGLRLVRETERIAAAMGARRVMWHAKQGSALEAILPKVGYGVHEIIFARDF